MTAPEEELRDQVRQAYSAAADEPRSKHPFPVGRKFALSVGYGAELLSTLPADAVDGFCGVSNVSLFAEIPEGARVLDLGCGAGLDSLVAAGRVGPTGKVIAVDFSETMLERARGAAEKHGARNVEFRRAGAEDLPVEDRSIDVALVNGIFNLNPARERIFASLARVVRPGGAAYVAEIIVRRLPFALQRPLVSFRKRRSTAADWFA